MGFFRISMAYASTCMHLDVRRIDGKRVATTEYRSWQMMKNRCLNSNAMDFAYYGGRGIGISIRWLVFENFLADMGRKPNDSYSIDRIDSDGHYCKSNCVWSDKSTQARNRKYCKITLKLAEDIRKQYRKGVSQKTLAKKYRVSQTTISLITRGESWCS